MGFAAWVQKSGLAPNVPYLDLKKFTDTADEKVLREEIAAAIDELNAAAKHFSSSRTFSRDYLALLSHAQGHMAEKHWAEAHQAVWEATFFVNRALETKGAARQRNWIAASSVLWLLFLLALGSRLKAEGAGAGPRSGLPLRVPILALSADGGLGRGDDRHLGADQAHG
jgi:hypothetical protein